MNKVELQAKAKSLDIDFEEENSKRELTDMIVTVLNG